MTSTWDTASVLAGGVAVLVTLADVFLTVLFPGSGRGPVRRPLARVVQAVFGLARHLGAERRRRVLAYLGPTEVAATLVAWFVLLLVGWAAIYHPALGRGVVAARGATDGSWGTALYFSGYDLTTLGLGDLVATTPVWRAVVVAEAATGFMSLTLAISYFVSVYSTLTARNSFAMALHDRSRGTGRGSDVVLALWGEGPVGAAIHLAATADGLRALAQTHRAYPVLRSFHYHRDYYALPRILLTCWETVTLLETVVDSGRAQRPELAGSALGEIRAAARRLTSQLGIDPREPEPPRRGPWREAWRGHHAELVAELERAGIPVRRGSDDDYLGARSEWDTTLATLSAQLLYEWPDDVVSAPGDPARSG